MIDALVIGGGFSSTATWAAISNAQKNKIPFLVCDLVEGESLAEKLNRKSFSIEETVAIMSQIVIF